MMAKDLGFSHTAIIRVISSGRLPGPRLLAALGSHPGVRREWLLRGSGEPLEKSVANPTSADAMLPLAKFLLPGTIDANRDRLSDAHMAVASRDFRPTRYWYIVDAADHVTDELLVGDSLLIESDGTWMSRPHLLQNKWCVILQAPSRGPSLRHVEGYRPSEGVIVAAASSPLQDNRAASEPRVIRDRNPRRRRALIRRELHRSEQTESTGLPLPQIDSSKNTESAPQAAKAMESKQHLIALTAVVGVVVLRQRRWPLH
jgi:hypothetical protein